MRDLQGRLRLPGEPGPGIGVTIDLEAERLRVAAGGVEIGDWALDEIRVVAQEDGFHVRAEGDEIILAVPDTRVAAEFAVEAGLSNAPPALRRHMSAIIRERSGTP